MAKDYAKDFYKSVKWRRTSKVYAASQHFICERCGKPGRIVHHKQYISPKNIHDPMITLNWENLEYLCQDCHTREHLAGSGCKEGLYFNSEGELIKNE